MKFSERIGAVRRVLQKDSIDEALRNSLWNVMYKRFWEGYDLGPLKRASTVAEGRLLLSLWTDHFYKPADEATTPFHEFIKQIREGYMKSDWWAVYDFVEFVVKYPRPIDANVVFIAECNTALEQHLSAYRFVGMTLAPITSEEEITAIEQAMSHGDTFKPVMAHLETALARLADRPNPDSRNSIKESISAVETACKIITGDPKATLGQALKKIGVHGALEKGFSSIYGYTSDAEGIRHALLDEPTVDPDDAKFFIVSCSAFINYLIAKTSTSTTKSD